MIQVNKLVQPDHIPIIDNHPYRHATNDDSLRVWHKLPRSYVQVMNGLRYERMNGEPKATQERNLIEAHFAMSKGIGFLV